MVRSNRSNRSNGSNSSNRFDLTRLPSPRTLKVMTSFKEFWPYYVKEHSRPLTRRLHFVGSLGSLILLAIVASGERPAAAIPAALVWGYGFAWIGHFFVEHNRPATFRHPLWSFVGDWKMFWLMLTGKMDAELARLRDQKQPSFTPKS